MDKHRTEREFAVGDMVYLKLVPYQLQSLNPHSHHKLLPQFYGPFEVLQRVGKVAYKLNLPATTKIHPVFHVSCLKKHIGPQVIPVSVLPVIGYDGVRMGNPAAVLSRRVYKKGNATGVQVLVHWEGGTPDEATWEDYDSFVTRFPDFKM